MSPWTSLFFVVLFAAAGTAVTPRAASAAPTRVGLKFRIVASRWEERHSTWLIELCNSAGEPLRRTLRLVGETVRFKNLLPGIYRVRVWGRGGRRAAVSVDLTPAPGENSAEFAKVIEAPEAGAALPGQYQVDLRTLEIPKEAREEMKRAGEAAMKGDREEAAGHLRRAVQIDPDYAGAWNDLGVYYHRKGDFEQALHDFSRVTELKPGLYLGWLNLGASLLATGRFIEAAAAGKKAVALCPDDAIANAQLAFACFYLHDYGTARKYFEQALELDPAMSQAPQLLLAQIAMREDNPDEAMGYLRGYLKWHPNSPNAGEVAQTIAVLASAPHRQDARR